MLVIFGRKLGSLRKGMSFIFVKIHVNLKNQMNKLNFAHFFKPGIVPMSLLHMHILLVTTFQQKVLMFQYETVPVL